MTAANVAQHPKRRRATVPGVQKGTCKRTRVSNTDMQTYPTFTKNKCIRVSTNKNALQSYQGFKKRPQRKNSMSIHPQDVRRVLRTLPPAEYDGGAPSQVGSPSIGAKHSSWSKPPARPFGQNRHFTAPLKKIDL